MSQLNKQNVPQSNFQLCQVRVHDIIHINDAPGRSSSGVFKLRLGHVHQQVVREVVSALCVRMCV